MRYGPASLTGLLLLAAAVRAQQVSFAHDVLPLLSDRCFRCHGPDSRTRKGELRLDDERDVFRPRDAGAIVVAGEPEHSELLRRITATDDDRMPPADSQLTLSTAEVATLRRWIEQGAKWGTHWSFAAPAPVAPPAMTDRTWPRNDIDAFVLDALQRRGQTPNPPAAPAQLLRRVTLDLTGLPPTVDELDAFVADPSDAAYERIVDALLASPRYAERMAWPWLEASRYADTDGYQADPTRIAWPWRDWLVRALDDNMPFDRFTTLVLAGDLLPDATMEQRLATGLLRNNAHNGEGGRIAEETRVENGFDRTETVATVWMGLTFECARCHDHKFDPITQRDYYRLFAFFDQTSESGAGRSNGVLAPTMRYLADPQQQRRLQTVQTEIAGIEAQLFGDDATLDAREAVWLAAHEDAARQFAASTQPARLGPWSRSAPFTAAAAEMFALAFAPETEPLAATVAWQAEPALVDGTVLALPDGQFTTYFRRTITAASPRRMSLSLGSDDAIKVWCNGTLLLQNDTRRGAAPDQERIELPLRAGDNTLLIKIVNTGGIGGIYCKVIDETAPTLPAPLARAALVPADRRTQAQRRTLRDAFRSEVVAGHGERRAAHDALQRERDALEQRGLPVAIMDELPAERRRRTPIYERGNYQAPRDHVQPGTPAFLPPLRAADGHTANRLDLARWLVSGEHPLTARVAVNRAWQTFFGRGLVATSEDFGRQGERPSHAALLDALAVRFVASGWNVKALHRLIVTSATYRQSAAAPASAFAADPRNEWLARSARHRLPAWMLRDQALALSGRLVERLGGEPVRPYQPDGVWAEATFGQIRYTQSQGEDLHRRSLYTFWRRIVGPTMLFDTPARQACVVNRSITNTPLHALTTLNETGFVEAARGLGARAYRAGGDDRQRVSWLFRAATARHPDAEELRVLLHRVAADLAHFTADADAARALTTVGATPAEHDIPAAELAAFTHLAALVLNLDEVLTRP